MFIKIDGSDGITVETYGGRIHVTIGLSMPLTQKNRERAHKFFDGRTLWLTDQEQKSTELAPGKAAAKSQPAQETERKFDL